MCQTLISFDLRADFGVFKKPDVNEGLQLTFNLLHKPALLGILGAIAGLEGYQRRGVFPEYYDKLRDLRVGIEPLDHEKGNFVKTVIKYNNSVGYANPNAEGGVLNITEQTLCTPAYRIYLLLDLDDTLQLGLHDRILAGETEFLPYLGKNECLAWWEKESVKKYNQFKSFNREIDFRVKSMFIRKGTVRGQKIEPYVDWASMKWQAESTFIYFERLPVGFFVGDKDASKPMTFAQYEPAEFVFTDWMLKKESSLTDLYHLGTSEAEPEIVQLF